MQATLRTNYFQPMRRASPSRTCRFKLDPRRIPSLPAPRPLFEIFVYSPRVEGVHLRGGKVARGGLRWSDRREDFRTEVLGLMKAQMVKNAVIVPVGSKGGFVVKRPPPAGDRAALLAEGVALLQDVPARPARHHRQPRRRRASCRRRDVVRYDGDDPYLVVAADKGTATFSDIANGVAGEYGFWLGDAFASGGSAGYDHKEMGITARGAWESVKRHFRELGHDTQTAGLHGRRRRRHVGRRVRQRHAAVGADQAAGGLRPPPHLPRPRPRPGGARSRSASACSSCRARQLGRLRPALISAGGGVSPRSAEVDPALARGPRGARASRPTTPDARTS